MHDLAGLNYYSVHDLNEKDALGSCTCIEYWTFWLFLFNMLNGLYAFHALIII